MKRQNARKLLHIPGLRITGIKSNCISCKKCNKVCPMSLDVEQIVQKENYLEWCDEAVKILTEK